MNPSLLQKAQIFSALQVAPLDRVRLMKALFLVWHRKGRPESGPFHFRPYLYGPCAFDLYSALDAMEDQGLLFQTPHAVSRWASFHVTEAGRADAFSLAGELAPSERQQIEELARWSAKQDFRSLLTNVYQEAPDYASRSVFQ